MELINLNIVMPNKKISEFPIASYPSPEDILLGDQGGTTKAFTWGTLVQYFKDNFTPKSSTDFTPIGSIHYFAGSTPPASFLICNGSSLSRTEYSELFAAIGTTFGNVDSSHFNLPDLRGEFIRGWDNGKGVDLARTFGSSQGGSTKTGEAYINLVTGGDGGDGGDYYFGAPASTNIPSRYTNDTGWPIQGIVGTSPVIISNNASETRPRNVALLPCIKATRLVSQLPTALNFIIKPSSSNVGDVLTADGNGTWSSQAPNSSFPRVKAWVRWSETSSGFTSLTVGNNSTSCGYNVSTITKSNATSDKRTINFSSNIGNNYVIVASKKEGILGTYRENNVIETKFIDGNSCAIYAPANNVLGAFPGEFHVAIIG